MTKTAVEEKEEFSLTPKVDYNKVAAGLSVLKRTGSREAELLTIMMATRFLSSIVGNDRIQSLFCSIHRNSMIMT